MIDFPARYDGLPEPLGAEWWSCSKAVYKLLRNGGIVALYGERGPGKTRMAYELAHEGGFPSPLVDPGNELTRQRRPAIYRTAMGIFLELRSTFQRGSDKTELEVIDRLSGAVFLVIDELQERGETRFEDQKLTMIIDARYQAGRPTLLIGNFKTAGELAASISPSIISRIQENGGAIHCDWPSFRG